MFSHLFDSTAKIFKNSEFKKTLAKTHSGSLDQLCDKFGMKHAVAAKMRQKIFKQSFYVSNDQVTYWDIPFAERQSYQHAIKSYAASSHELKPVHLFVAEGDIFSWLSENIPGDILIVDIDQTLLDFLNTFIDYLKSSYQWYKSGILSFDKMIQSIKNFETFFIGYTPHNIRHKELGPHSWLSSEERYRQCMESLLSRNIKTFNIDLFHDKEAETFVDLLKQEHYVVSYFNLTNLPDYDTNHRLTTLLESLPYPTDPKAKLFQWNVHDRGPDNSSLYNHFLCYSNNIETYKNYFKNILPTYLATKDFSEELISYISFFVDMDGDPEFSTFIPAETKMVHNIKRHDVIEKYIDEFNKLYTSFNDFLPLGNPKEFLNMLISKMEKMSLWSVNHEHAIAISQIISLLIRYDLQFSPGVFETLKLNKEFADNIFDSLEKESAFMQRDPFIKHLSNVYLSELSHLLWQDNQKNHVAIKQLLKILKNHIKDDTLATIEKLFSKKSKNPESVLKKLEKLLGPIVVLNSAVASAKFEKKMESNFVLKK